jgi:hypothetical protein
LEIVSRSERSVEKVKIRKENAEEKPT